MQDSCMQKNVQATLRLAETNNSQLTRPAVFSGVSVGSFPEQRLVIEPRRGGDHGLTTGSEREEVTIALN